MMGARGPPGPPGPPVSIIVASYSLYFLIIRERVVYVLDAKSLLLLAKLIIMLVMV